MAYTPQTWTNGSAGGSFFINGPHLQHIEDGIEDADTRTAVVEAALPGKADASAVTTALALKADATALTAAIAAVPEQARDAVGAALVAGANVTITVNDPGDTITIAASGGGGGITAAQAVLLSSYLGI